MIAGEQKLVSVEQHRVTASVTRNGNREQIIIELHRFASANHTFDTKSGGTIIGMHYSLAAKPPSEASVVGHIVTVS